MKVVCVDADHTPGPPVLKVGATYEIAGVKRYYPDRAVVAVVGRHKNTVCVVLLTTVQNPYTHNNGGFAIERFRPLTEVSETDETEAKLYHKKHLHARRSERERA